MSGSNFGTDSFAGVGIISAGILEVLGVPLQPIVWGLLGGVLGAGFAKPTKSKAVAIGIYLVTALISALLGFTLSKTYAGGSEIVANSFAAGISMFFHPVFSAVASKAPEFVEKIFSMVGAGGSK